MAKRITDAGALEDVPSMPIIEVIESRQTHFTNGITIDWQMAPKYRRVDVNVELRGTALMFPGSGCIPGSINAKWIKEDHSVTDWNPTWTTGHTVFWSRRNANTFSVLQATFLRTEQDAAPHWRGTVQSTVRYIDANNAVTVASLTGMIQLNEKSGRFSIATFSGNAGHASSEVLGYL